MTMKASVELVLNLHNFKNISLPYRAKYQIMVEIYQGKHKKNLALPYNIIETSSKSKKHIAGRAEMDDFQFRSKSFKIAYHQQQVELNDLCQFKMNIEAFPELEENSLFIEFALLYNQQGYYHEGTEEVEYQEAERYRYKLENIQSGVIQYCEGEFPKTYVSTFSFSLFLMIANYKFVPYRAPIKTEVKKEITREKLNELQELMAWAQKYNKNCASPEMYFYQHYVKNLRYNSFILNSTLNELLKKVKKQIQIKVPQGEKGELVVVNEKAFYEYITNFEPPTLNHELIQRQIFQLHEENFFLLLRVVEYFQKGDFDMQKMKGNFYCQQKDRYEERIFKSVVYGACPSEGHENVKIAKKMRKSKVHANDAKIIDEYLHLSKEHQHYAFLQINLPQKFRSKNTDNSPAELILKELTEKKRAEEQQSKIAYDERNMLVVFVHGFQASSYDMEILKREISKMLPVSHFLASSSNELDTDTSIDLMGLKLGNEIKAFVDKNMVKKEVILNFVCHSMGGLISRASFQHLKDFHPSQFGFFFSLSSPHLGYLNGVDGMIKTGLWFMRKAKDILSLDQLAMEDFPKLRETLLYKLSSIGSLKQFKKIIFLSSTEDSYVPWHSARVSPFDSHNSKAKVEEEMIEAIVGDNIVHRIDVHFDIETKDLDSFIGRTAHINLIIQESIMKLINTGIPSLFDITQV